ncbi:MAG TPA: hypothetical protein DSN98_07955 [Thermoplasmata archaeon]|nr:MAG TPA: hypothetical protein DSN98_07955 [Thermoplasmata archaeon]
MIGTFQIQNIGDSGSLLNWTINTSLISWGTWSYDSSSGENLTPGDGQVTVHVSVIVPNEKDTAFDGYVRVENQNNPDDFDVVPVYLKTPFNTPVVHWKMILLNFFLFKVHQWSLLIEKIYNEL